MPKESTWKLVMIVVLAISLVSVVGPAGAQIPAPEPIDTPVQDQWRGPFERFLGELRVSDQKAMAEKTNAFQIGGVWRPDSILFRIEDPTVCSLDLCFTVIGRVIDNKFIADAMFAAGKRFTRGDNYLPLFGFQAMPAWLVGDRVTVTLLETPNGWIIAMGNNQTGNPP
jgi:hypothetical protein